MKLFPYIKIIRPLNIAIIATMILLFKYAYLESFNSHFSLDLPLVILLIVATCCIAAGGNVINDVYDIETDRINKPAKRIVGVKISETQAVYYYLFLTIIGVASGFVVSYCVEKPSLAVIFVICAALLYGYALSIKKISVVGNVLVSFLVAMSNLLLLFFDVYPAITNENMALSKNIATTLLLYAAFAFSINVLREIVKDIIDVNGDKNDGRQTIPVLLGKQSSLYIAAVVSALIVSALVYYCYIYIYHIKPLLLFFLFLVIGPLLVFTVKIMDEPSSKTLNKLSFLLKIIMIFGMLSVTLQPVV